MSKKKSENIPHPNSLLIQFLQEFQENAIKNKRNSRFSFKKAIDTLKKYPLAIKDVNELHMLQNFGSGIISALECRWHNYKVQNKLNNNNVNITDSVTVDGKTNPIAANNIVQPNMPPLSIYTGANPAIGAIPYVGANSFAKSAPISSINPVPVINPMAETSQAVGTNLIAPNTNYIPTNPLIRPNQIVSTNPMAGNLIVPTTKNGGTNNSGGSSPIFSPNPFEAANNFSAGINTLDGNLHQPNNGPIKKINSGPNKESNKGPKKVSKKGSKKPNKKSKNSDTESNDENDIELYTATQDENLGQPPNIISSQGPSRGSTTVQNKAKNYVPAYRSGAFALLITLLKSHDRNPRDLLTKEDLIRKAQPLCDASFTISNPPGSFTTAWLAMNTLLKKELVIKVPGTRPLRYQITVEGQFLARRLITVGNQLNTSHPISEHFAEETMEQSTIILNKNLEIILIVDDNEYWNTDKHECLVPLIDRAIIKHESRKLNIGDFLWIARDKEHPNDKSKEIVLDFVVERKRTDDLCYSIIDGRYHEQKNRLKKCGVKNIVYLIEGKSLSGNELKENTLLQSLVNTIISENFIVHRTTDLNDTFKYLLNVTNYLKDKYEDQPIMGKSLEKIEDPLLHHPSFLSFNEASKKTQKRTVKEVFSMMLMHIDGMSFKRALAITDKYPTYSILVEAYDNLKTEAERENLLKDIITKGTKRKIGPALSKTVYRVFYLDLYSKNVQHGEASD